MYTQRQAHTDLQPRKQQCFWLMLVFIGAMRC